MELTGRYRIGAFIIDMIIVSLIASFIESMFSIFDESSVIELFGFSFKLVYSLSIPFYLSYFILFDLLNDGKSIGKMVFGIKVVFIDYKEVQLGTLLKRTILKTLSIIILPISVLMFVLNKRFTFHDYYTNTITVREI